MFIEIGPDGTLSALGRTALGDGEAGPEFIPLLRSSQPAAEALTAALARAHVHGATVDWAAIAGPGERIDLPTYAFQHQRYWPEPAAVTSAGGDGAATAAEAGFWAAVDGGDLRALSQTLAVHDQARWLRWSPSLASWRRRSRTIGDRAAGGTGSPGRREPEAEPRSRWPEPGCWSRRPGRRGRR